jgi:hypothetical protein
MAVFLLGAGAVAVIIFMLLTISATRTTQVDRIPASEASARTLKIVEDCVRPDGVCAQRNQDRLADTLRKIRVSNNQAAAAGARCATLVKPVTYPKMLACINRLTNTGAPTPSHR